MKQKRTTTCFFIQSLQLKKTDKFAIIESYESTELQELGLSSDEIKKYKKITNYDEIIINQ